jgi:hypothetical protein
MLERDLGRNPLGTPVFGIIFVSISAVVGATGVLFVLRFQADGCGVLRSTNA